SSQALPRSCDRTSGVRLDAGFAIVGPYRGAAEGQASKGGQDDDPTAHAAFPLPMSSITHAPFS
ncbi:hypothetical protein KXW38_009972, partial [Aspergillus fumigatus]